MTKFTTVRSLLSALAKAMNLINPDMENHHQETAYLAYQIGMEMGLHTEDLHLIASAALLHDVGTIVMPQRENLAAIESHRREIARIGAEMIRDLEPFEMIANIIELCQNGWRENVEFSKTRACSRAVHGNIEQCIDVAECIHLADVISALWDEEGEILNQVPMIREAVEAGRGMEFSDKAVDAFQRVSQREFVWMDFVLNPTFLMFFTGDMHDLSLEETVELTQLMSRIIDFRSSFTAMHSAGVAASAKELARLAGMNEEDCMKMEIAGNLHDVGKLRVPNEILEKPGKLTEEEFNKVKEHPYYSCFYNAKNNSMESMPTGTRTEIVYNDSGEIESFNEAYNDGEATFALDEEGYLIWHDEKEDAGKDMRFEKVDLYSGAWICGRASMEIALEDSGYKVFISWPSGAAEVSEWEYSCVYSFVSDALEAMPFGIRTDLIYGEDGEIASSNVIYEDGEATFSLDENGYLLWQDAKEDAGKDMRFERVEILYAENNGV